MDFAQYIPQRVVFVDHDGEEIAADIQATLPELEFRLRERHTVTAEDFQWADTMIGYTNGIEHVAQLRWVHSSAAGVDALLRKGWAEGVLLTRTVGKMGQRIAEYCLAHALAHTQFIRLAADQQRQRSTSRYRPELLRGTNVVVFGTGEIGQAVGNAFAAVGCRVLGVSRTGRAVAPFEQVVAMEECAPVLAESDWIVFTLPLTEQTRHIFNADRLSHCNGAKLISVGRGAVVDAAAMLTALDAGQISAAVLDVFEKEPLAPESPLWTHPQVVVTPHIAGRTDPEDVAKDFLDAVAALKQNSRPRLTADPARGY